MFRCPGVGAGDHHAAEDPTTCAVRDHRDHARCRRRLDQSGSPEIGGLLIPSRVHASPHLSTRQYARILDTWIREIGLDPAGYGTHSVRRTKASLIYRRTKNLRAVQLLLGHSKLESTVRYLGIEVDDALEMAEQTEV